MKGDFTRFTFRPERHYTRVLKQQGRVEIDADSNEQIAIDQRRHHLAVLDLVGACSAPIDKAGFGVTFQAGTLVLSKGRCYVNGVLCENEIDALPITSQPDLPGSALPTSSGTYIVYLDVWERLMTALDDPSLREVALGGPDTSVRDKLIWQVKFLAVSSGTSCVSSLDNWDTLSAPSGIKLAASAVASVAVTDPCIVPAKAGYRSLENQLYRVEIHDAAAQTFKWSRDNGTIVTQWLGTNLNDLQVSSTGRDATLGFAAQQWVELTDDGRELKGNPGTFVRLVSVQGLALTIDPATANGSLNRSDFPLNPKIRRWDSAGPVPITAAGPIQLENGVQVQFTAGTLRTGDYWTIPARTIPGNVEWPIQTNGSPQALPPQGITHSFGRIAVGIFDGTKWTTQDCRRLFGLIGDSTEPGIHITGVTALNSLNQAATLINDANVPCSSIAGGIDIQCDGPIAPESANRATVFMVLETAFFSSSLQGTVSATSSSGYQVVTLAADISVAGNVIRWRPRPSAVCALRALGRAVPPTGDRGILARLILKGNFILSKGASSVVLDGDAFGVSTGSSVVISFPTGDGHRGGDFHSWFWLSPDPALIAPAVTPPLTLVFQPVSTLPVRSEGIAELIPDLLILATGGMPTALGAFVPLFNLQITLNPPLTSRFAGNFLEVVMRVDEPRVLNVANIDGTTAVPPTGVGGEGFDYQNGCNPNIFRASPAGAQGNQLMFTNIPLDPAPPGSSRTLRISNIRLDASGPNPTQSPLFAFFFTTLPLTNHPPFITPAPVRGLEEFTVRDNANNASVLTFAASSLNNALVQNPALTTAKINCHVHFTEGFPTAFKNKTQESGFLDPLVTEIVAVSNGTMLRASFAGIPAGLLVFVTTREVTPGTTSPGRTPKTRLVSLSVNGAIVVNEVKGTGTTVDGIPIAQLSVVNGTTTAIWEWIDPDSQSLNAIQEVSFGIVLAASSNQVAGSATLQGALNPVSSVHTSTLMPVPRFVDSPVPMPNTRNAIIITAG